MSAGANLNALLASLQVQQTLQDQQRQQQATALQQRQQAAYARAQQADEAARTQQEADIKAREAAAIQAQQAAALQAQQASALQAQQDTAAQAQQAAMLDPTTRLPLASSNVWSMLAQQGGFAHVPGAYTPGAGDVPAPPPAPSLPVGTPVVPVGPPDASGNIPITVPGAGSMIWNVPSASQYQVSPDAALTFPPTSSVIDQIKALPLPTKLIAGAILAAGAYALANRR